MTTSPLAHVFRVKAIIGKEKIARQELTAFVSQSHSEMEEGYALFQGIDDPTCFMVYGICNDRAIHKNKPDLKTIAEKIHNLLAEPSNLMFGTLRQPDPKDPPDTTIFLGWMKVKTGLEKTARQELVSLVAQTRSQEPGCLNYDLFQSVDDTSCYLMYSVMKDQEAIAAHKEAPYFKTFVLKSAELFDQVKWWRIKQSSTIPSTEWKQVVGQVALDKEKGNGFDNQNNTYVFPRCVFGGYLYVGTRTPDDKKEGCEVWRSSDGVAWEQVVGGETKIGSGFGNPNNVGAVSITIFGNNLYVGTRNLVDGSELWRSSDGQNWQQVVGGDVGGGNGFGNCNNQDFYSAIIFAGRLYIGTNNPAEGCEVWRSNDGVTWEEVVGGKAGNGNGFGFPNNVDVFSIGVFNNRLYVGIRNDVDGCEIWRSNDGVAWERAVNDSGFGNPRNIAVASMAAFGGYIHAGTFNPGGCEIWRSSDGVIWEQTVGSKAKIDGGFGFAQNVGVVSMLVVETYMSPMGYEELCEALSPTGSSTGYKVLYVGTATGKSQHGCEVWRTNDGLTWEQVVGGKAGGGNGFGDSRNGGALSMAVFGGHLYVGTVNHTQGGEIWRLST